jgi:hypothetical protein
MFGQWQRQLASATTNLQYACLGMKAGQFDQIIDECPWITWSRHIVKVGDLVERLPADVLSVVHLRTSSLSLTRVRERRHLAWSVNCYERTPERWK